MSQCTDPYVESVRDRLLIRAETGLTKYGTDTTRADLSRADWLRHAQEEALDLAVYLERLIHDEGKASARRDPDDCGDDWEAAGDLMRDNTRFEPDTPDWERAQTAVLAGILDGREMEAREHQAERDRDREALTRLRAECDRLRLELAAAHREACQRTTLPSIVGFGTHAGTLHLFESADDFRAWLDSVGRGFGSVGWVEGVAIHWDGEGR